ncbi:P1 family peptidase [Marinilongibacter aquaticus]|uniref:DmpA family aminopeptidase n=1 Tax=Marinilongibacter aquaticus TaxID=2975157 RepID=UPI0021BDB258|nr:P1 family peptidase [Marinilongibacter aquaticus]UBM59813.1 P1 family peptidase [Marinilongibacter aquaticus]
MKTRFALFGIALLLGYSTQAQQKTLRDYGLEIGVLPIGQFNAITDVQGLKVGHVTKIAGDDMRTGVTAIIPHSGNIFQDKVAAAIYIGNGFGKLAGYTQVKELGNIETPILLTNTLNVPKVADALIDYTLAQEGNEKVRSLNPVVGETNDGGLNNIQQRYVEKEDVFAALKNAKTGPLEMGNVGAGTGTVCFGFKGGIGTASRKVPDSFGGYTVGVLVQTNFGGVLQIAGAPVGKELKKFKFRNEVKEPKEDGSCMIVVATDAPLQARNLERLAKRALLGLGRTGGTASNGSGDYVIAFSTHEAVRMPYHMNSRTQTFTEVRNDDMSILFQAAIEATEEAILNSLFAAETLSGNGITVKALPKTQTLEILRKYNLID